jgi:hypothetical protein
MIAHPSLFTFLPRTDEKSDSIMVDDEVIMNLTHEEMLMLQPSEKEFVEWYWHGKKVLGLRYGIFSGHPFPDSDSLLDMKYGQEEFCAEVMRMINAPTIPDPDFF